jgi:hypothetical protein
MLTTQKDESFHVREYKFVRGQPTGWGSFRSLSPVPHCNYDTVSWEKKARVREKIRIIAIRGSR